MIPDIHIGFPAKPLGTRTLWSSSEFPQTLPAPSHIPGCGRNPTPRIWEERETFSDSRQIPASSVLLAPPARKIGMSYHGKDPSGNRECCRSSGKGDKESFEGLPTAAAGRAVGYPKYPSWKMMDSTSSKWSVENISHFPPGILTFQELLIDHSSLEKLPERSAPLKSLGLSWKSAAPPAFPEPQSFQSAILGRERGIIFHGENRDGISHLSSGRRCLKLGAHLLSHGSSAPEKSHHSLGTSFSFDPLKC